MARDENRACCLQHARVLDVLDRDLTKAAASPQGDRCRRGWIWVTEGLNGGEGRTTVALDEISAGDHQTKLAETAIGGKVASVRDLADTGKVQFVVAEADGDLATGELYGSDLLAILTEAGAEI